MWFEGERAPLVQRVERAPVIAGEGVLHLDANGAFHVLVTNLREAIRPAHDHRQLVLPVPLAQRRGHAAGAANRRQLLVGDDDDLLDALERVEDGGVERGMSSTT